jgi:hypothetical protein
MALDELAGLSEGILEVISAIQRTGRFYKIRNGELNTRCPVCGDSKKSVYHAHLYLNLIAPHKVFCQRCGYKSPFLTVELLEGLGAAEREAAVYVRQVEKHARRTGGGKKKAPSLAAGASRLFIPQPDRTNTDDRLTIEYIENRLNSSLSEDEIQRYKIITCGLYGFLELNGIDYITIPQREGDRLNETCIGFLSADESYIIFRSMDDDFVKRGGRRYTNYRIYQDWEGSKSFVCRSDINLSSMNFNVVCSEGIIDLMQIEKTYYPERRWTDNHIGVATCGATHDTILRQLVTLGLISQTVDLYIDNAVDGHPDKKLIRDAKNIPNTSPFFKSREFFKFSVYRNMHPNEKDFGVPAERLKRQLVKL